MKLKITEYFWAVGKKTRRVKSIRAPLVIGPIKNDDVGYIWQIDEVSENKVMVSVICRDGEKIKTFTVEKGKGAYWRPFSMDGGHEYIMKLVRFF